VNRPLIQWRGSASGDGAAAGVEGLDEAAERDNRGYGTRRKPLQERDGATACVTAWPVVNGEQGGISVSAVAARKLQIGRDPNANALGSVRGSGSTRLE